MRRVLCTVLTVMLLSGCVSEQPMTSKTVFVMDTVMELQIWGAESEKAAQEIEQMLKDLEYTWSAADQDSFLSSLNRGEAMPDTGRQWLLGKVQALSERTAGAFDPKLQSVIALWGFLSGEYAVPTLAQIQEALRQEGWNLGAVVKGYAGDLAVETLKAQKVDRALLNLGGNIQTYGTKADGTPWKIGIQDPEGGDSVGVVSVEGTMAVVTSGDYQRYFEKDGVRYHHIIDPRTGYPADSGIRSVTVICRNGITADALSTALYVMGLEKGTELWRKSDDFEAVFILTTGEIYATQGANLSGCAYEVIPHEN